MNDLITGLLFAYAIPAAILFTFGLANFADDYSTAEAHPRGPAVARRRTAARVMFLAWVWPIVLPLLLVRQAIKWVPIAWKAAWS